MIQILQLKQTWRCLRLFLQSIQESYSPFLLHASLKALRCCSLILTECIWMRENSHRRDSNKQSGLRALWKQMTMLFLWEAHSEGDLQGLPAHAPVTGRKRLVRTTRQEELRMLHRCRVQTGRITRTSLFMMEKQWSGHGRPKPDQGPGITQGRA